MICDKIIFLIYFSSLISQRPFTTAEPTTVIDATTLSTSGAIWEVREGESICIRAIMDVELVSLSDSPNHPFSSNVTTNNSSCGNLIQILVLVDGEYALKLKFVQSENGDVYAKNISISYPGSEGEIEISGPEIVHSPGEADFAYPLKEYFWAPQNKSYKCNSQKLVWFKWNTYLRFTHVQVQAFGVPEEGFGEAEACGEDSVNPYILSIVIGSVLFIMIVVSAASFFYLHRQRRLHSYVSF